MWTPKFSSLQTLAHSVHLTFSNVIFERSFGQPLFANWALHFVHIHLDFSKDYKMVNVSLLIRPLGEN
jgi:hypothetical protein